MAKPMKQTKPSYDELIDALKEVSIAFREDGTHLERMSALFYVEQIIKRAT